MNPYCPQTRIQINAIRQLPHYHAVEIPTGAEQMNRKLDRLIVLGIIAVGLFLLAVSFPAHATGNTPQAPSAASSSISGAAAVSGAISGASASTGAVSAAGGNVTAPATVSTEVTSRAFGGGSTGLTGNAPCQQSVGIGFNALSFTFPDKDCLASEVAAKFCKDDECRKKIACGRTDIPDFAKEAIGCK